MLKKALKLPKHSLIKCLITFEGNGIEQDSLLWGQSFPQKKKLFFNQMEIKSKKTMLSEAYTKKVTEPNPTPT